MLSRSDVHRNAGLAGDRVEVSAQAFSTNAIPYLLSSSDALVILLSSVLGGTGYQFAAGNDFSDLLSDCTVGLLASFIYILRMSGGGHYDLPDSTKPRVEIGSILVCWLSTGLLLAFFAFLLKVGVEYSRGSFVAFLLLAPIGLLGARKIAKIVLVSAMLRGAMGRPDAVLIGEADELEALKPQHLLAFFGAPQLKRFVLDQNDDPLARAAGDIGAIRTLSNFVKQHNCREILIAVPWSDNARLELIREQIKSIPVAARLLPDMRVRALSNDTSSAGQRLFTIEIQRAPLNASERSVKRLMDIGIASLALAMLFPLMVLTAIAIRLDSAGPIIFRQHRKGFNGKQFVMFKFRTMTVQENGDDVVQATRDDVRVTSVGRLLRSSSIDELPQLINVLKGDMSLIGPRPHALAHDNQFEKVLSDYAFRHHVKPGMTGWAQCNGARGATPSIAHIAERVRLDLWYINNWNLWLDCQILIKTFFEVLRKRNAY
jgi:Undecaprenyl-phosphate glucose phosphotransferase